jgi:4-amino-4-deoxychorismate lyase
MCRFIESIQVNEGEFKCLDLHQERIRLAMADYYPGVKAFDLADALSKSSIPANGCFKCRIVYDTEIRLIEFIPYIRREIHSLRLVEVDIESAPYKKEDRSLMNAAFALRGDCDDIIMVKNGLLTDTSFTNIAFYEGTNWYTPRLPLIYGVKRAQLIKQGRLTEKDIAPADLLNFKRVSLFNAMNEFGSIELDVSLIQR